MTENQESPSVTPVPASPEEGGKITLSWQTIRGIGRRRWFYLPRLFSRREKMMLLVLAAAAVVSFFWLTNRIIARITIPVPAVGGIFREGVTREPQFINPIYASNDTDRDLVNLVFSKLVRYNSSGTPIMDLAESIEISPDGKSYTIHLRRDVLWHDGESFSADDVLFTLKTIQDSNYKSPLRQNWQGVTVEKADENTVRLTLRQPYAPFIENLAVGIIPEHLWRKVPRETAILSDLNLKPIGTGPYKFDTLTRREDGSLISVALVRNSDYHLAGPYLEDIQFLFYKDEEQVIAAYRRGEVDSLFLTSAANAGKLEQLDVEIHKLHLPKIFAVFLNPGANPALARKAVRQALSLAIDREAIVAKSAEGGGIVVNSAIPDGTLGFNPDIPKAAFSPADAQTLLKNDGWKDSNSDGVLERTEVKGKNRTVQKLEVRIVTSDVPELAKAAELVRDMWQAIGVKAEVKALPVSELETSMIRPRAYEALIFGEVFGHDPDPFAFWHTSQLKDPGLNIALYSNLAVDKLLEDARQTNDTKARGDRYRDFQKIVNDEIGALFLYSPEDYYIIRKSIKGVTLGAIALPEERFNGINEWYTGTRRAIK